MATNLVSSVMQCLTPDLVAKIARSLGIDPDIAQKVVAAAVPTILASFGGLAASPGGAQQLSGSLQQQHPDMLAHISSAIGGSDQKAIADTGSGLLSSLLGGGGLNALVSAVSSYAGIDQSAGKSILGLLAPMVVGTLGQQQRSGGLDANGLADLLASQKDQITAAIPSGLANMLGARGLLDGVEGGMRRGADSAGAAAGRMTGATSDAARRMAGAASSAGGRMAGATSDLAASASQIAHAATRAPSTPTWPLWILGLVILGGLGWYFLGDRTPQQMADQTRGLINSVSPETANKLMTPSVADLTASVKSSVDDVRITLQGINDPGSARAALPKLREMTEKLDRINNLAAQLPPGSRKEIAAAIGTSMPALNQLCDRILSTPQVGMLAKPTIDALRLQLQSLSRA
jgi:hypothetical protein